MKKIVSSRLPDLTLTQIEDLKNYYEKINMGKFSTARIIIICVNAFWKKIYEQND